MNNLTDFITTIENKTRRADAEKLINLLQTESGYKPHLAGSIIGFGKYHYRYESGLE